MQPFYDLPHKDLKFHSRPRSIQGGLAWQHQRKAKNTNLSFRLSNLTEIAEVS